MELFDARRSEELFSLCAFKKKEPPAEFKERVEMIVKLCGGLPLALKVVGQSLSLQGESAWEDVIRRLSSSGQNSEESGMEGSLFSIMRQSYESLSDNEQEMFLDVATCFHGASLEEVKNVWEACVWGSPEIGWQKLLDMNLVQTEDRNGTVFIYMHELFRDLGRRIATQSRVSVSDLHIVHTRSDEEAKEVKVD